MINSKCLSSRRAPLWVAAYSFRRLKKAQVLDTDISSSVDKILKDEIDAVSYRVLAYLLLGVVRIYSKKVEFLFHDCNELLIGIKKFFINTKDNADMETLRMSITIPDKLELDAFDLDILEDAGDFRGHIAPQEEITLKDVLRKTEGFGQFSLDKYQFEEFDFCQSTCSADQLMAEDVYHSHLMDMDFEVFPTNSPINLLADKDKFHNSIFCREELMNFDTVFVVEGENSDPVNLFSEDQRINEEQSVQEASPFEDEIHEESRISQDESDDISIFSWREKEPVLSVELFNESHQVHEEGIMANETFSSLCQMNQEIREVHEASNSQQSIESPQDDTSCQKECMDHGKSSVAKENLGELIAESVKKHDNEGKLDVPEKVLLEDGNFKVILPESVNLDETPESKFQGGSIARPKPGAITPEFMPIPTPAVREGARFSRKRKCVLDEFVILPNEVLRQSIYDTRDLISNRRKFHPTLLTVQRQSRISALPEGFYESVLPCYSLELQSLFSERKIKISDSFEIVETSGKLDESESQAVGRPEHNATAPQTPPQCSKIIARSIEHPESTEIQNSDNIGPLSPSACIERNQSLKRGEELNLMEEFNVETSRSYENLERGQSLIKDEDLSLMNEEISSYETENSEFSGWSERTRKVASYLHRSMLDLGKHREEEVVNFSQVLGGRVKKDCARLFYEILVLRTTSFVDVKQNNPYGDISVRKLPKLDETFRIDGP